jgi:hypothetical protein
MWSTLASGVINPPVLGHVVIDENTLKMTVQSKDVCPLLTPRPYHPYFPRYPRLPRESPTPYPSPNPPLHIDLGDRFIFLNLSQISTLDGGAAGAIPPVLTFVIRLLKRDMELLPH